MIGSSDNQHPQPIPLIPTVSGQESPRAHPEETTDTSKQAKLRTNAINSLKALKGHDLSSEELAQVDSLLESLEKINKAGKELLAPIAPTAAKAPWKVRGEHTLTIGDITYSLQLGKNYKALLIYKVAQKAIGEGVAGFVRPYAIELLPNLEVVQKLKNASTEHPKDLAREAKYPKMLHEKAGGHQPGIQYAPYGVQNFGTSELPQYGLLARRYKSTLYSNELLANGVDLAALGLDTPRAILATIRPLFEGLAAMHTNKIAHADIKPLNIGIQISPEGKPEACLADFGTVASPDDAYGRLGTHGYVAYLDKLNKESPANQEEQFELCKQQDVFALGRSILETLDTLINKSESLDLFLALNDYTLMNKEGNPTDDPHVAKALEGIKSQFSPELAQLLSSMIDNISQLRPTAEDAVAAFPISTLEN